jgi:DNA-binding transcriptional LysR family regulator
MMKPPSLGQLSDIDIRLLRVFRVVSEAGGISAAELELNIGRSTISRHIKDLEMRLGVTLCSRGRSGFSLTDEGKAIYASTLRLMGSLDEFRAEVSDVHRRMTGHITLALFDKTVSNPECHISKALALFDDVAPQVSLDVYVEPLNEIERGVMEGRFQVGVIPSHRESSSLSYQALFHEQMWLYCGEGHELFNEPDELIDDERVQACRYAGLGYHSPNMEIGRRLEMERAVTAYDQEAIAHLLLSGRYIGYLPDHYARSMVEQGQVRPIRQSTYQYSCEFLSIARNSPKPSRAVSTFLQCLAEAHPFSRPR